MPLHFLFMLILFSSAIKLDFRENRALILHRPICKIKTVISCSTSVLVKISRELLEIYRSVTEEEVLMKKINQVGVWGISMRLQLVWQTNCLLYVYGCHLMNCRHYSVIIYFAYHYLCSGAGLHDGQGWRGPQWNLVGHPRFPPGPSPACIKRKSRCCRLILYNKGQWEWA